MSSREEAVQLVLAAWREPGWNARAHELAKIQLAREWPTLYAAVNSLDSADRLAPAPTLIEDANAARQALGRAVGGGDYPRATFQNTAGPFSAGLEPPVRIRTDEKEQ